MPTLTVFKNVFVSGLRNNIPSNLHRYLQSERWALETAPKAKRDLDTRIELKSGLALDEPDDTNLKDLENAIRVHKVLGQLTPLQARDPRLWTRLTHVECWHYMRRRWPVERFTGDADKAARFIAARYFVSQSDSRALLRNGIARLWWTSYLSFDSERTNPYELTAVLLSSLDITQQILERNMGRGPIIVKGFLEFLLQNKSLLLSGGDLNRDRIRRLAKFLNMHGGVCLLDSLTQTDIIKLLDAELERIAAIEGSKKKQKAAKIDA
jgi:hypothetical protein